MTSNEAKEVLLRYRPGSWEGSNDPELTAALVTCDADESLRAWFRDHCRMQSAIRDSFQQICPPPGLKEQIISEYRASQRAARWRQPQLMTALAVGLLVVAGALLWNQYGPAPREGRNLMAFQTRMASTALRGYNMKLFTNDLAAVRTYLAGERYPADFTLPRRLDGAQLTGCGEVVWQNQNVSLICFLKQRGAAGPTQPDLWLFVMDGDVPGAPAPGETRIDTVNRLSTATWREGKKIYLLGTEGGEAELRKWL